MSAIQTTEQPTCPHCGGSLQGTLSESVTPPSSPISFPTALGFANGSDLK